MQRHNAGCWELKWKFRFKRKNPQKAIQDRPGHQALSICKANYLRLLMPEVLRDALWLVTKYGHMATYGHGRNHPGESQRDRAKPPWNICPTTLPVVAGSHRHVHLIDAGIHVRDRTVHAPAASCADKVYETIQALKLRLDRDLLTSCRNT